MNLDLYMAVLFGMSLGCLLGHGVTYWAKQQYRKRQHPQHLSTSMRTTILTSNNTGDHKHDKA